MMNSTPIAVTSDGDQIIDQFSALRATLRDLAPLIDPQYREELGTTSLGATVADMSSSYSVTCSGAPPVQFSLPAPAPATHRSIHAPPHSMMTLSHSGVAKNVRSRSESTYEDRPHKRAKTAPKVPTSPSARAALGSSAKAGMKSRSRRTPADAFGLLQRPWYIAAKAKLQMEKKELATSLPPDHSMDTDDDEIEFLWSKEGEKVEKTVATADNVGNATELLPAPIVICSPAPAPLPLLTISHSEPFGTTLPAPFVKAGRRTLYSAPRRPSQPMRPAPIAMPRNDAVTTPAASIARTTSSTSSLVSAASSSIRACSDAEPASATHPPIMNVAVRVSSTYSSINSSVASSEVQHIYDDIPEFVRDHQFDYYLRGYLSTTFDEDNACTEAMWKDPYSFGY